MVKNPPDNAGDTGGWDRSLGREAPLEEKMATHSSILAWEILWISNVLKYISIQRSLAGYSPQRRKESDTTEAT